MTAEEFLTQELKLVDHDGYIQVERTEHYRHLYLYDQYKDLVDATQILNLLYRLQAKGFSFEFISEIDFKISIPPCNNHYLAPDGYLVKDGWYCEIGNKPTDCLRKAR